MGEKRVKMEISPEITRQVAMRRAIGISLSSIEKEFGFSRPVVNRVLASDMAKAVIKGVTEDAVASAVIVVRRKLADMTPLVMAAIEHHLREKNLDAVKIYFKGLGLDTQEKTDPKQQQSITVILPGAQAPKDIPNGDIEV